MRGAVDRLEIPFSPLYSIEVSSAALSRAAKIAFVHFAERFPRRRLHRSHPQSPQSLIRDLSFDSDFFSGLQPRGGSTEDGKAFKVKMLIPKRSRNDWPAKYKFMSGFLGGTNATSVQKL